MWMCTGAPSLVTVGLHAHLPSVWEGCKPARSHKIGAGIATRSGGDALLGWLSRWNGASAPGAAMPKAAGRAVPQRMRSVGPSFDVRPMC